MSSRAQICYTSSFEDTSYLKDTATSSFISFCFTLALISADIMLQNFIQIIWKKIFATNSSFLTDYSLKHLTSLTAKIC